MEKLNITTARLIIRNLTVADLSDFHLYRSNPEVTRYQGFDVMTIEQADQFIRAQAGKQFGRPGEWVQYGIENKSTHKIVGDCAIKLSYNDPRIAETGITISHIDQKKGYAKEALSGILFFLFNTRNIHRVVEIVDAENIASINLFRSLGFRHEGHFIENVFFKGKWGSEYQYAMLKRTGTPGITKRMRNLLKVTRYLRIISGNLSKLTSIKCKLMSRYLISSGSSFEKEIGYSRAVVDGDWIFVSGTTGFDYETMTISDDIAEQTEQCIKNIRICAQAGACRY